MILFGADGMECGGWMRVGAGWMAPSFSLPICSTELHSTDRPGHLQNDRFLMVLVPDTSLTPIVLEEIMHTCVKLGRYADLPLACRWCLTAEAGLTQGVRIGVAGSNDVSAATVLHTQLLGTGTFFTLDRDYQV